jgi:hypothetical protein
LPRPDLTRAGIANGCFFNLGARLARYTGNQTYADWAEKTWDWMRGTGLMDNDYNIYDGGHVQNNCTDINRAQFSYNNAVFLLGAAHMYNYVRPPLHPTPKPNHATNLLSPKRPTEATPGNSASPPSSTQP